MLLWHPDSSCMPADCKCALAVPTVAETGLLGDLEDGATNVACDALGHLRDLTEGHATWLSGFGAEIWRVRKSQCKRLTQASIGV